MVIKLEHHVQKSERSEIVREHDRYDLVRRMHVWTKRRHRTWFQICVTECTVCLSSRSFVAFAPRNTWKSRDPWMLSDLPMRDEVSVSFQSRENVHDSCVLESHSTCPKHEVVTLCRDGHVLE